MSKKPETLFNENKVVPFLKSLPFTWYVKFQPVAANGIPDFLVCVKGHFVALESKKDEKEKPKPLQKYNLEKISYCYGTSLVIHPKNWDEAKEILKQLSKRSTK
jgi:hypothetical protein